MSLDKKLVLGISGKRMPSPKQMKHIGRYLSSKEKFTLIALVVVTIASGTIIGVKYAKDHLVEVPAVGGEYTEGSVGGPRFINPLLTSSNDVDLDIVKLIFSGLMKTAPDGQVVTDLAESADVSDDGKVYTFHLHQDVQWHDGTVFAAADVLASMGYIKNAAWKSPFLSRFKNVAVEAPDQATVVFTLPEPFAPFLSMLTIGILPEHLWQDIKPENTALAELNVKPIGTGPYKFKSFTKDKKGAIRSYTLERNEDYYGQPPYLQSLTFKYFTDFGSATDALVGRRVDGLSYLPLEFREAVEELQDARMYTLRLPQYTALFLNEKFNPFLESKKVRQALALAADRNRILKETLGDSGVPVHGPILPGFVGFHPDIKKYQFDLEAAASLLDDDGWEVNEESGLREKGLPSPDDEDEKVSTPLTVTITTVDTAENIAGAQIIKEGWEGIGVNVELEIVPSSKVRSEKIRPREYDVLLYGEIIGPDPDPFPFWHSSQADENGLNLTGFASRRVDELLESARTINDDEKRAELYVEFQDILAEDVAAIFLYSPTYTYVVSRKVQGIDALTIFAPADRFTNVNDWYMETEKVWQ